MKTLPIILSVVMFATMALAQEAPPPQRPPRQGPPVVQCPEMKKLMEQIRQHRQTCEICKTNLPPRGQFGPRGGRGPMGGPPPQDR